VSGLFGLFHRHGTPVAPEALEAMRSAMAHWGPDGGDVWREGPAGLGQLRLFATPEARFERLPHADTRRGVAFTGVGRVDNRAELLGKLGRHQAESELGRPASRIGDAELLLLAYERWGEACVDRIYGDWSFAAWHPADRKLFVARDHHGNTALYYYADPRVFAFASDRKALLALNLAPQEMDELYLAYVLVSWPVYRGERTILRSIRRLPPAHTLRVTPNKLDVRQYWRLADTPEVRQPRREDYVEGLREVFVEAVRARLRTDGRRGIGVMLSGGLDSGSVTAVGASLLRAEGKRLAAFTAVPELETRPYVGERFGDEYPLAQATAEFVGNVDHQAVPATTRSPIEAMWRQLRITNEPPHGPGNLFWVLEVLEAARSLGCGVLLTGQVGNATISWLGRISSQPLAVQLRHLGLHALVQDRRKALRGQVSRSLPRGFLVAWRRRRTSIEQWSHSSAIHPDFAARLDLLERLWREPEWTPPRTPREERNRIVRPGRGIGGTVWAENGAAHGLEVRDPTADVRVLEYTWSVPDRVFMDPETGLDRWLIREAMRDRLPDQVRLNRRRGRQAGDLVPRMRACASEVEEVLRELADGPAARYVDVGNMRAAWGIVRTEDTTEAHRKVVSVVMRGAMAGLFVNDLAAGGRDVLGGSPRGSDEPGDAVGHGTALPPP
jgi:asparagine synthase (glutamine-hydrolysing)